MKRRCSSMQQSGWWSLLTAACLGTMAIESAAQGPLGTITKGDEPSAQPPNATAPKQEMPPGRRRKDDDDEMARPIAPGLPPANAPAAATTGQPGHPAKPIQTAGPKPPPTIKPGTAQDAVYWFCIAVADGDTATASDYIGYSAIGIAAKMREGELPEERIAELAEALNPTSELESVQQRRPSNLKLSIRNKQRGQTISFVLKKDKEIYKIVEVSFTKAKEGKDTADTRDRS